MYIPGYPRPHLEVPKDTRPFKYINPSPPCRTINGPPLSPGQVSFPEIYIDILLSYYSWTLHEKKFIMNDEDFDKGNFFLRFLPPAQRYFSLAIVLNGDVVIPWSSPQVRHFS